MNNAAFFGLVLAGGRSSRMGMNKAMLLIDGITLLQRSKALLSQVGVQQVLISGDSGLNGIPDVYPDSGPLGGIHAALLHVQHDLLVVPVDMPLLTCELLVSLIPDDPKVLVSYFRHHPLPLFIRYHDDVVAYLESVLSSDENKKIRGLFQAVPRLELPCPDESLMMNVNTPSQWADFTSQASK
ncbi:molybdenum cofactor guanylyltransferase [Paraneptunicella aestuarii]|uniref:molybdenum cofactor guanylyltransferase n=1 Tax=Paraneptunicella aestuarii TaxID=2831148 RepID=UPI001E54D8B4|nr:molybdenum cofactor guanylyltransferase [Paraneptunicella aestuarii]UAA37954.1 molybdenum cofactor guanylyltransferase [Paraneptunicella aestuarii]